MENIGKIVSRIEADVQLEIDAVTAQTKAKVAEINAEYEKKAQEEYARIVEDGKKSCNSRAERLSSTAQMEAKKSILAFKQEMVSKAFAMAEENMKNLPADKYVKFLAAKAAEAAQHGSEELVFSAKDRKEVGDAVAKAANAALSERGIPGKLTVSGETREISGGVIVKHGDIEANCTTETFMQLYRNELASQVAEILFA